MPNYTSDFVAIPSAAYTTAQTAGPFTNNEGETLTVIFDVTALTAGASLVLTINGIDKASGRPYLLLAGAAVTATNAGGSPNVYRVGAGLPTTANVSADVPLPEQLQIVVTPADTKSVTYSVGASIGV